ncbi:N-6 DNA methylase [Brevundimonas bullata]|uniref:N-6 DNA methylase n=1 Tax=Brevundimonas bullata TaxID=13160 RepID=UPI002FD910F4
MADGLQLVCPVRGTLKVTGKSKDGLRPSEEYFRVEAIRHLISLGYPKDNFLVEVVVKKFGNAGRNSVRCDFAVLDKPASSVKGSDIETVLDHSILLCEVKRDNADADYVKSTQVRPLLDFSKNDKCVALYWDNAEQRIFWNEVKAGKRVIKEGSIAVLPPYGQKLKVKPITMSDLLEAANLIDTFDRIEDILHTASVDPEARYEVMLQLLLAKLFDEHAHQSRPTLPLEIQDYTYLGQTAASGKSKLNLVIEKAVKFYQMHLPKKISTSLPSKLDPIAVAELLKVITPIKLIASKRDVIQSFYMKFAKGLYKWDLAQFFTPPTVTDFIVRLANPQFGEHIKDPACGSGDFLTAAFHMMRDIDPKYADCLWGVDNSDNAVQVAVLNMLLNGDGKTNIKKADSLATVSNDKNNYEILLCNPPFGIRIVERNPKTLEKFDLGHAWSIKSDGTWQSKTQLLAAQETGMLFAELCVKQAKPGGRIGLILPNGYLGNRSDKYWMLRSWLLRHCKLVAVCAFPRFTFKTSGADVSASIVYLEKRSKPLKRADEDTSYSFAVEMIEKVGWNLGDKKAAALYQRDPEDGTYIVNSDGDLVIDADFERAIGSVRASAAAKNFPWLRTGAKVPKGATGWARSIKVVTDDPDLTLDAKRHCRKFVEVREAIAAEDHFRLGDLVEFVKEKTTSAGKRVRTEAKTIYRYAELQDMGQGDASPVPLRGWELPARAKHFAEAGDLYVGSIWGSVGKWFLAPADADNLVVTNGCHRLRMKSGKAKYLPDLIAFLCSEAYRVQMRGFARGSDGLAEVAETDTAEVVVPQLSTAARKSMATSVDLLAAGRLALPGQVEALQDEHVISYPQVSKRPSHVVLV